MKKIKLTQGKYATIDDEDYQYIKRFSWKYCNTGGAERAEHSFRVGDKIIGICMERFIVDVPTLYMVLHKDGDTLNNQKKNLLVGDSGQKNHNQSKQGSKNGRKYTSIYKGVCLPKGEIAWRAHITDPNQRNKKGKKLQIKVGSFKTEKEAARAYNKKAIELYGRFAYQNKV